VAAGRNAMRTAAAGSDFDDHHIVTDTNFSSTIDDPSHAFYTTRVLSRLERGAIPSSASYIAPSDLDAPVQDCNRIKLIVLVQPTQQVEQSSCSRPPNHRCGGTRCNAAKRCSAPSIGDTR